MLEITEGGPIRAAATFERYFAARVDRTVAHKLARVLEAFRDCGALVVYLRAGFQPPGQRDLLSIMRKGAAASAVDSWPSCPG